MSLTIFNKIQDFIRAKVKPDPDPALVSAADVAEILENLNTAIEEVGTIPNATATTSGLMSATNYRKAKALPTLNSSEIEILTVPKLELVGSYIKATAGSIRYAGSVLTIPATTGAGTLASTLANKQFFALIFPDGSGGFETIPSIATPIGGQMPEKLFAEDTAYAGLYQYSGGVLSELPFNYATSAVFSDGSTAPADAKGVMDLTKLTVFKPILALEFGTEPTVDLMSQEEVNAYLFALASGGTYTPPTGTISSASAAPLSDTEIQVNFSTTP